MTRTLLRGLRYAWSLPNTTLGAILVAGAVVTGGRARAVSGVLEAHGGLVTFFLRRLVPLPGGASAMTLGHVVVGRDVASLDRTRSHERAHVRQFEQWGPFFLPAYLAASVIATLRRRHYYRDNWFEKEAVAAAAIEPLTSTVT
jgi:hypothetical protein